jgi:hypothetical protein
MEFDREKKYKNKFTGHVKTGQEIAWPKYRDEDYDGDYDRWIDYDTLMSLHYPGYVGPIRRQGYADTALYKEMVERANQFTESTVTASTGGRRRTKNAKYYNKRRGTKRRRSKRRRSKKHRA